ncbi:MAG: peptidase [Pirellulaceae bacterium]|nr:peptidase [Pirellulaceae bacterium]
MVLAASVAAHAQQEPQIGYVYPAGGQQGQTIEVTIGGQNLRETGGVLVSGGGVQAEVVSTFKPLTPQQANQLRQKLQEAQKRFREAQRSKSGRKFAARPTFEQFAQELGISPGDVQALAELRRKMTDPKRQPNPQIEETVTLKLTLDADTEPGPRDLRLTTASGLTNPLKFHVGRLPEYHEHEPNDRTADRGAFEMLPVMINGQILPGDVDRFAFAARQGQRLVASVGARQLIPYLADAVPGWFQATLAVYDSRGNELSFADDFRFLPDPLLYFEVPEDGTYELEIRDAVYRGREDFVYRITLGELPLVTSIFPLGGRQGESTAVESTGWNLTADRLVLPPGDLQPGIHFLRLNDPECVGNPIPFGVGTLPEVFESEPNETAQAAQTVALGQTINGRIDRPGDWDVFRFEARGGDPIVAEVIARRLYSPLDSVIELTDGEGHRIAVNDDFDDKGAGLLAHQADSRLEVVVPSSGVYFLRLGDVQNRGGSEYAYRLRISAPQPDFELRVVPSAISAAAGSTIPVMVYALRRDGFAGEIQLALSEAPTGFRLSGGRIPGGQDHVRLTLTVPPDRPDEPARVSVVGHAEIDGRQVTRTAIPADDKMQAFAYRHLVPAQDLLVAVTSAGPARGAMRLIDDQVIKLPVGGSGQVRFFAPAAQFYNQIQFELDEAPEGIAIGEVSRGRQGISIQLTADENLVQPGLKGNLIVEAFTERTFSNNRRRVHIAFLPAIKFETVPIRPTGSDAD